MKIINKIVSKVTQKRLQQIEFFRNNPEEAQSDVLKNLIKSAENTVYGKKYKFKGISLNNLLEDYKKNVPITDYEKLLPYINRVRAGERNVLWNTPIKWFAMSSGTTSSKSKFIPVSKEALEFCHFRGGKDIIALYADKYDDTQLVKSKSLVIGGSQQISSVDNELYYGDISAVIIDNLPVWSHLLRTPKKEIALLPKWEEKLEKMVGQTTQENVTSITGVPSWTLVLLKKILEVTGKKRIEEVWPNFELFIHGGVSFIPYKTEFEKILPERTRYLETYNATEGFFGIQDDLSRNDLLLMLDLGIFYEFIPVEDVHKENLKTYTVKDVELNKNYAMIISTNGGLWRYLIGDTVMFTSLKPHKIIITGRIKHFINAFGEELIIDNAEKALLIASEKTNAHIKEYTAAPIYMSDKETGGHEWLIDFSERPENLDSFIEELDRALKSVNSDYAAKRYKDFTLKKPVVHIAKNDVFYKWLKQKGKLGGQNKIPRLSNNRDYIDELLELNDN
ncbi:MAG: GH3 auxin-responsive promoter family protein [Bacteroidales bacterium]|nr:GH3 auxin-responsive promoter family protein [Bacteroidales bacterium]